MKIEQEKLIYELKKLNANTKTKVQGLRSLSLDTLNSKPVPDGWSALECIEHLNLYGNFYLPEIENRLTRTDSKPKQLFKSGLIGNYFVNMIKATNKKKMKTVSQMDTSGSDLNLSSIDQFIKQLDWLDSLLEKSSEVDLSKTKTNISLTKHIKLRLGDTLRFVVHHNERHIVQAERAIKAQT